MTDVAVINEPEVEIFGSIFEAYRREGFDAGYQQATRDLLDWLVIGSEEFLRGRTSAAQELRPVLYAFVEQLEHRIVQNSDERGFVEGGLGI